LPSTAKQAIRSIAELEKEGNKVVQIKLYAEVYTISHIIVK